MDEYPFITLARLQADRLKLEREQRLALAMPAWRPDAESESRGSIAKRSFKEPRHLHQHLWSDQS